MIIEIGFEDGFSLVSNHDEKKSSWLGSGLTNLDGDMHGHTIVSAAVGQKAKWLNKYGDFATINASSFVKYVKIYPKSELDALKAKVDLSHLRDKMREAVIVGGGQNPDGIVQAVDEALEFDFKKLGQGRQWYSCCQPHVISKVDDDMVIELIFKINMKG